jgi:acetoin:2,6-dichlorophenolindophenol oxidoreductase subunit alpha
MDVETVYRAAAGAVAAARTGAGPAFLECRTYRFDAHHTWEHKARVNYRPADEVTRERARDPLDVQARRLDPPVRRAVDADIGALLDDAVRYALGGPRPDPASALDHLYASGMRGRGGTGGRRGRGGTGGMHPAEPHPAEPHPAPHLAPRAPHGAPAGTVS